MPQNFEKRNDFINFQNFLTKLCAVINKLVSIIFCKFLFKSVKTAILPSNAYGYSQHIDLQTVVEDSSFLCLSARLAH